MKRFRRAGVAGAVVALIAGLAFLVVPGRAGATPFPPSTSSCTYNGNTAAATGVTAGGSVTVSCTGLPSGPTSFLLAEASPLGGVVDPPSANSNFADTGALGSCTGAGTGSCTGTFAVPAAFAAGDANGVCPPTQAQVNAGLVACALAVVNGTSPVNTGLLFYTGQPTPQTPTASIAPAGLPGETFAVTGSGWWGGGILGVPNAGAGVPGFTTLVGATPAANTLTATPPVFCASGAGSAACSGKPADTLVAPSFSGSITIPSTSSGPTAITIVEPNASGAGGLSGIPASESALGIQAQTPFNVLGTPAIQVAPTSGGQGVSLAVNGSNFDPQGGSASVSFNAGTPTPDSVSGVVVHADGTFSTTLAVGANEVATIPSGGSSVSDPVDAAQTESADAGGAVLTASTPFTVNGASAGPCNTTGSPNSCKVNQVIDQAVTGVPNGLVISEAAPASCTAAGSSNNADGIHVTLGGVTLNGRSQTAHGCLNTVTIEDARGTLAGWTTTGQLETDFLGPNVGSKAWDHVIPAQDLTWTPAVSLTFPGDPSGVLSEVAAGSTSTLPTANQAAGLNGAAGPYSGLTESSVPVDLCSAAQGGGGGTFNCDAGLALVVPAFVAQGTYQSTLDLVVS